MHGTHQQFWIKFKDKCAVRSIYSVYFSLSLSLISFHFMMITLELLNWIMEMLLTYYDNFRIRQTYVSFRIR